MPAVTGQAAALDSDPGGTEPQPFSKLSGFHSFSSPYRRLPAVKGFMFLPTVGKGMLRAGLMIPFQT